MEAFSLFANAKYLNKMAATILTISDIIPTHEAMSPEAVKVRSIKWRSWRSNPWSPLTRNCPDHPYFLIKGDQLIHVV